MRTAIKELEDQIRNDGRIMNDDVTTMMKAIDQRKAEFKSLWDIVAKMRKEVSYLQEAIKKVRYNNYQRNERYYYKGY